ncbi:hypothetical protein [Heyndrickxia oleronia]
MSNDINANNDSLTQEEIDQKLLDIANSYEIGEQLSLEDSDL